MTSSGSIGELASTCQISEPCKFIRKWAIGNKPSGGIAAIRTNTGGLQVYHVARGVLVALASNDAKSKWFVVDTGIKANQNTSLAAHTPMVEGAYADPVVLFVSPEGKLQEAGRNQVRNKWEISESALVLHKPRMIVGSFKAQFCKKFGNTVHSLGRILVVKH